MKYLLLIIFLFFGFNLIAQEEEDISAIDPFYFDINAHFSSSIPINQLKGNMDPGFGFGIGTLVGKQEFPLKVGFDFGFHWHNRVSTDIWIYNGAFDELHELSTSSYSITGDIIFRGELKKDFPVVPYADVFIGFNRFSTWTSIEGEEEFQDDPTLDNFNSTYREMGDWTRAYGLALGLKYIIVEDEFYDTPNIQINLRAAYRKGGAANYLVKKDDFQIIDSTIEAFEEKRSVTDFLMIQLGVTIQIE